ncbi:phosphoadenylyl-sulfate reductase, partial [Providencia huaxiensis]|uniref:phosphoadenylyl-sulfate reductase n=1 Tax=Providencia huaxiensis TaxID=2027290 RepID=UPI0034E388BA
VLSLDKAQQTAYLSDYNVQLEKMSAIQRIEWALEHLPAEFVLSSSFGIQAALTLHMVTQIVPDIPVILTDTGYLFPETYQFIEHLSSTLNLNLQVYRAQRTPAWQEAIYGQLWTQGIEGIERYNQLNKVEPMERALHELQAQSWFSGLRREQSTSRANLSVLGVGK